MLCESLQTSSYIQGSFLPLVFLFSEEDFIFRDTKESRKENEGRDKEIWDEWAVWTPETGALVRISWDMNKYMQFLHFQEEREYFFIA